MGPVGLRVPLERGIFSKNKHHLVSCHKKVFNKFVTSRVPDTSLARVSWRGRTLCYRGGKDASGSVPHGKIDGPLRGVRWGSESSESPSSGTHFLRTIII